MMNSEQAESRLNNIQAIEPLLSALRTLSLGSWQSALKKINEVKQYEANFDPILSEILPRIKTQKHSRVRIHDQQGRFEALFVIIGAERGLCGKFNKTLSEKALSWIDSKQLSTYQVWALGSNMIQLLDRNKIDVAWNQPLNSSFRKSFTSSYLLAMKWLKEFEDFQFDELFLIFNQQSEVNKFRFSTYTLIPFINNDDQQVKSAPQTPWPPPIIESNPISIYNQIIIQKIASRFFLTLQQSTIAENYYRYSLLQDAEENAKEMIQDLLTIINTNRRHQITQEVQELASGAGLLDN